MMTAAQLMQTSIRTLTPTMPIGDAVQELLDSGLLAAPVVDERQRVVGAVSERDCMLVMSSTAFQGRPNGTVAEYMRREVLSVPPSTDLMRLAFLFYEDPLRILPVVDGEGRIRGLITGRDVIRGLDLVRRSRTHTGKSPKTYVLMEERHVP